MLENNEVWKDCKGYEGLYQVSNLGRVWSVKSQRVLKPAGDEYLHVCLTAKNGKLKNEKVHRLVALAFIDNPDQFPCVNHKDEDKKNNCVDNLEWCSYQYNNAYGTRNKKKIVQLTLDGEYVATFNSVNSAAEAVNRGRTAITECLKGRNKSCAGYRWLYLEDYEK